MIILAGGFLYYAYFVETGLFRVVNAKVKSAKISGKYSIMHLSDFHLFKNIGKSRLNKMREIILKWSDTADLDFVFITGDFIDNNSGIDLIKDLLSGIKSKYGVFAVLGNHDYFQYNFLHVFYPVFFFNEKKPTDLVLLKKVLHEAGIKLLIDECTEIDTGIDKIRVIGIDPGSLKKKRMPVFTETQTDELTIVMSHYPEAVKYYKDISDIILSGHTHGGQITLFGLPLVVKSGIERKNAKGVSVHGGSLLFVSKGLGSSRYFPFRFFANPDFNIIEIEGDTYENK